MEVLPDPCPFCGLHHSDRCQRLVAPRAEPTNAAPQSPADLASVPSQKGAGQVVAGAAPTPETDALFPSLNLSYQDLSNAAWHLRRLARRLERERDEAGAEIRTLRNAAISADERTEKAEAALAEEKKSEPHTRKILQVMERDLRGQLAERDAEIARLRDLCQRASSWVEEVRTDGNEATRQKRNFVEELQIAARKEKA